MIKNLSDLNGKLIHEWAKLDDVRYYLNDAGKAKMEALRALIWLIPFFSTVKEFYESEELADILKIEGKNSEYYNTIMRYKKVMAVVVEVETENIN